MKQERIETTREEQEAMERLCHAMADAISKEAGPQQTEQPIHTIHLAGLFFRLLDNFKYVVLTALLFAILGIGYAQYFVTPTYSATAKLYILGQESSTINLTSLQIGTVLTMDYQEVFKTWEVHYLVKEELGLSYGYNKLQSMLKVTNPEDTRVLYITVTDPDPQLAADIANAYAKAAQTFIIKAMDSEAPISFSVARKPSSSNTMGRKAYGALGFILGTLLSVMVISLHYVFDDRPIGAEDLEEVCGLPTLAVIPKMKK